MFAPSKTLTYFIALPILSAHHLHFAGYCMPSYAMYHPDPNPKHDSKPQSLAKKLRHRLISPAIFERSPLRSLPGKKKRAALYMALPIPIREWEFRIHGINTGQVSKSSYLTPSETPDLEDPSGLIESEKAMENFTQQACRLLQIRFHLVPILKTMISG